MLFVIDDLGWTDVGYRNGSGVNTPFLDQLASGGIHTLKISFALLSS